MLTQEHKQLLHDLKNTSYGRALTVYLEEKFTEIGDITSIPNDGNLAAETLGRRFALKLLKDLFNFMENKKISEKSKNPYV